jgi:hypothetical protein
VEEREKSEWSARGLWKVVSVEVAPGRRSLDFFEWPPDRPFDVWRANVRARAPHFPSYPLHHDQVNSRLHTERNDGENSDCIRFNDKMLKSSVSLPIFLTSDDYLSKHAPKQRRARTLEML